MTSSVNTRAVLVSRPVGLPLPEHFRVEQVPRAEPGDGEVLVEVHYIDVQPAMRGWLAERPAYTPPIELGATMRAQGVGRVLVSRHAAWREGDYALGGNFGVQRFSVQRGEELTRVDPELAPLQQYVGALGSSGLTGYFGMLEVGQAKPGDVVVVSSAAGAVGSVAGQLGKILGCRVVGIAGGPEKCAYLVDELGLDAAIDYKAREPYRAIQELCPEGIDVYFDNVGGDLLDAAMLHLRPRARVVISGMISQYNNTAPSVGARFYGMLLVRHARMEGFLVRDYAAQFPTARKVLAQWLKEGRIKTREQILPGVESFPAALPMLFDGRSFGKLMICATAQ
jgi:NADPH-dependent curcumin reductase CurA